MVCVCVISNRKYLFLIFGSLIFEASCVNVCKSLCVSLSTPVRGQTRVLFAVCVCCGITSTAVGSFVYPQAHCLQAASQNDLELIALIFMCALAECVCPRARELT